MGTKQRHMQPPAFRFDGQQGFFYYSAHYTLHLIDFSVGIFAWGFGVLVANIKGRRGRYVATTLVHSGPV